MIVRDLVSGPRRFVELQRVLPGISTEQLRSRLNRMVADGLLTRQRYREVPPRVDYELTERARALMPVLGALARWGRDWTWSPPRSGERVDIGAILRCLAGERARADGRLACTVSGDRTYVLDARDGAVTVTEAADPPAGAHAVATGPPSAWIRALGPEQDPGGLAISGAADLIATLLGSTAAEARTGTAAA